jgi:hypothetical protein
MSNDKKKQSALTKPVFTIAFLIVCCAVFAIIIRNRQPGPGGLATGERDDRYADYSLRFMFDGRPDSSHDAPQIYGWLQHIIDTFQEENGVQVELVREAETGSYDKQLLSAMESRNPPDVLWVPHDLVTILIEQGSVVPIDEWIGSDSELIRSTPEWIMEHYSHEGRLYGIAAEDDGEGLLNAYMLTTTGEERFGEMAIQLISHLKTEVMFNPMPNLVIEDLTLHFREEELYPGDELRITARVGNHGKEAAEGVEFNLVLDDEQVLFEEMIEFLEPDADTEIEYVLNLPEEGTHYITAIIDPHNLIFERDENDNMSKEPLLLLSGSGTPSPPAAVKSTSSPFTIEDKNNVSGYNPRVAFDGTNYLVVWARLTPLNANNSQIVGTRISPSGTILDPGGFVITSKKSWYYTPQIAFDGTNYLVVWEDAVVLGNPSADLKTTAPNIIEGARISTAGAVLDKTPITIDDAPLSPGSNYMGHESPDVCFDGGNFVVTYRDLSTKGIIIVAKQVTGAGVVSSGKTKLINSTTISFFGRQRVTWNSGEGLLGLLGCQGTKTYSYGIHSAALTYSGGLLTTGKIQTAALKALGGSVGGYIHWFEMPVVASSSKGKYLLVYEDERNKAKNIHGTYWPDISAAVVESPAGNPGGLVTDKGKIVSGIVEEYPEVAFDGKNYCVVYRHHNGCHAYVGTVRVTPGGVKGTTTFFKTKYDLVGMVDVAFGTTNGLVVFDNFNPPSTFNGPDRSNSIYGQFIEKSK